MASASLPPSASPAARAPSPPPSSAPSAALPAHLQTLLGPLAQSPAVLGLLVLARAPAPADTAPGASQRSSSSSSPTVVQAQGAPFEGDAGRLYALRVAGMVEAVEKGCVGADGTGDPLKFLRIRTAKHELIITPDPNFVLVVLHDPAQ